MEAWTMEISERGYARPERLVSTQWVADHMSDPGIRVVEVNEDVLLYDQGHVPGAIKVDWTADLNDPIVRDYLNNEGFQRRMRELGIRNEDSLIFYGDKNNWWATYALWVFNLFGHRDTRIMDGGRTKWMAEGRPVSTDVPQLAPSSYTAPPRDDSRIRAFRHQVREHLDRRAPMIDVRSPEEYAGTRLHMPDYPNEGALRGGHIPGAKNVPWARAVNPEDATFKSADELRQIYEGEAGLSRGDDVVTYCRIGERSSHTWFVLTHLLGYERVRNYDGSWTEWGNSVGVPIER
jgi:thiosulfate/3-mercaptopyruvate sulfurtransferase